MGVSYYADEGIVGTSLNGDVTMEWWHWVGLKFADSLNSGLTTINISYGYEGYDELLHNEYPYQGPSEVLSEITSGQIVMATPIPAAAWLFGSGLIGLAGIARRKKA